MSSIFKPNFDKFSSKVFVLPPDEYEFEIGAPKLRSVDIKKGDRAGQKMHMLSVPTRVIRTVAGDTEFENKPTSFDFIINVDKEDGFNRILMFAMAANGIVPGTDEADAEFKERFGNEDWSVDVETATLGTGWQMLQKKRFIGNVKRGGNTVYPRAELASFRPF
jgi:hypothetical protein